MKRILTILLIASGGSWCQTLDFSSLDKLASRAKEVNRISLNQDQLKAAMSLLASTEKKDGKDMEQVRRLVEKLTGIEVRNFEFAQKGAYRDADLTSVREQMGRLFGSQKSCSKVIDSKEEDEHSEIYMCVENGKTSALGIISAEPTELSVVLLKGSPSLQDLQGLGGVMALPTMALGPAERAAKAAGR